MNWLVKGARVWWSADDSMGSWICLTDGRIAQIGADIEDPDARLLEAEGLLLLRAGRSTYSSA